MATETLRIGKLFYSVIDFERAMDSNVPGIDELSVHITVTNSDRPLGEAGRPPHLELRDADGVIYEPVNLDASWFTPRPPDTSEEATLRFRIPEEATGLELVLAPGTDEEASVELEPVAG